MNKVVQVFKPVKTVSSVSNGELKVIKRNVAAYARVSTDYEDQINSYRVQCEEYTTTINSNPTYNFVGVYADQGLSGTQTKKRPEFLKMISDAKNGKIDLILTKSISRFARNTVDTITTVRELRDLGVEIYFEKENISSLDPKIDFMLTILSSIAQEESRSISTNVKWAYDKKFKNGVVDARRIYGFDVIDGELSINETEAKVIQKIFNLALERYKPSDIMKRLNDEGILTPNGKAWSYGTIRHILANEKYCGDAVLRKTVTIDYLTKKQVKNDNIADKYLVSNNHPAIISKEIYDSVQIILNDKNLSLRNTNKETKYPLTGIIICPRCGRSLKRQQVNRGKNMRIVLNCNHSYGNEYNCVGYKPDYEIVVAAVNDAINEIYANPELINTVLEAFNHEDSANDYREQIKALERLNDDLLVTHYDDPENTEIYHAIEKNKDNIKILESKLVHAVTATLRYTQLNSFAKGETLDISSINVKDFFSLIISDERKVTLVISPTKNRDELASNYKAILAQDFFYTKIYITDTHCIYYEVKLYA